LEQHPKTLKRENKQMKNILIRLLVLALLISGTLNLLAYNYSDPLEQLNTDFYGTVYTAASVDGNGNLIILMRKNESGFWVNHHIYIADVDVETDISSD
jgi:hypothetical protein